MKKSIYLAALAALTLSACSSDSNDIFDQSAAERLEQYKKDYADILTEDGGIWAMEYFSNPEEPGYLFAVKFEDNGSVTMAANHKWINNAYKEETSLWRMIADNGPVLSFSSYNSLFHIFSDPANITGPEAPKKDDTEKTDIDETGFGHEGDYEFQVMEVSEDHKTIRLMGKKYLYMMYLRKLDASTDLREYMDDYKTIESGLFSKEITNLVFTDSDGERYVVSGGSTGLLSFYPENGDPVDQTHTGNFIITKSGIRFMEPLELENAAGQDRTITEFNFTGNYSLALAGHESAVLNAGTPKDYFYNNLRNWKVDLKSLDGSVKTGYDKFVEQLRSLYNYKSANVTDISFEYDASKKLYVVKLALRTSSKGSETDRYVVTFENADGGLKIVSGQPFDSGSELALNAYTELQNFFGLIFDHTLSISTFSDCGPKTLTLSVADGSFTMSAI